MNLREIARSPKTVTDYGSWKAGPIPQVAFRLSRAARRSYCLGPKYQWRLVQFEALGRTFRVLIAYRLDIESYRAWLALEEGNDLKVLARYEFHGTHPGWHCHAQCDDVEQVSAGTVKHLGERRLPPPRDCRRTKFGVTDQKALTIACEFFGLTVTGDLGL